MKMQPPRPMIGALYDKDMFTFLPAPSNKAVLAETSRKRKLMPPDHVPVPEPTIRYGSSGMSDRNLNTITDDLRSKEFQNSILASSPGESFHFGDYSHKSIYWDQKSNSASRHSSERDHQETTPGNYGNSCFSGRMESLNHKDTSPFFHTAENHVSNTFVAAREENVSHVHEFQNREPQKVVAAHSLEQASTNVGESRRVQQNPFNPGAFVVGSDEKGCQTRETSACLPLMTEHFNQLKHHHSNAPVAKEDNASHFQEFQNHGPQKVFASGSYEQLPNSQSLQQKSFRPGAFCADFDEKGSQAYKNSAWPPLMTEHFNQPKNNHSNAHLAREENAYHFEELRNSGLQKPVLAKGVSPDFYEPTSKTFVESPNLQQNCSNPGTSTVALDEKGCQKKTYTVKSPSDVKQSCDGSSFARFDNSKIYENNVGNTMYSLQETNNLLQHALRLLSASSGIDANCSDGKIQGQGHNENLKHSLKDATQSKNDKDIADLDRPCTPGPKDDQGPGKLVKECILENGASAQVEKLWDGTLQLSSSSSILVSAIAFYKSGEKMQDFSWPKSVEVKGKVRLEAFEKYVQDLPRSRTRGLMVTSLCWKEGFSDFDCKSMKEVARKYKEGKKVGFAQLSSGVDMYICPHSDTIITILAKHGFFKGMTAVKDKSDPLIGCVVWRKNSSSVTSIKPGHSLNSPTKEISTMGNKKQELNSLSSEGGETVRDRSPEFCASPLVDQPNLPSVPQNNLASVSSTSTQLDLKSDMVVPKQSGATSDDDLPEYDFAATVSQTAARSSEKGAVDTSPAAEKFTDSQVSRPMSAQVELESSAICRPLDFRFEGLVPHITGHETQSHKLRFPVKPHKQTAEFHFQATVPLNIGHKPELESPSLPVQQQMHVGNDAACSKPRNLFDDDDMPEWCPPNFTKPRHTKPRQEVGQGTGQSFSSSHSKVPGSNSSSDLPPSLPAPPPSTQLQFQGKDYPSVPHYPRLQADRPTTSGFTHSSPAGAPAFAPNSALRPQFDPSAAKNPIHPSAWRGSRP